MKGIAYGVMTIALIVMVLLALALVVAWLRTHGQVA